MPRLLLTAALALASGPAMAEWLQIADSSTFTAEVVGGTYADADGNWFRFNANRTLSGGSAGRKLTGTWQFQSGMACFDRQVGGQAAPSDCIVVLVDGNRLVTVRDNGRGSQAHYRRQ